MCDCRGYTRKYVSDCGILSPDLEYNSSKSIEENTHGDISHLIEPMAD